MHKYLHILMCFHSCYTSKYMQRAIHTLPYPLFVQLVLQNSALLFVNYFISFSQLPEISTPTSLCGTFQRQPVFQIFTLAFFFFTFFNSWTSVICGGKEALQIDNGYGFHLYPPKNMVARINFKKLLGNNIKSYLIKQMLKGILQVYQFSPPSSYQRKTATQCQSSCTSQPT